MITWDRENDNFCSVRHHRQVVPAAKAFASVAQVNDPVVFVILNTSCPAECVGSVGHVNAAVAPPQSCVTTFKTSTMEVHAAVQSECEQLPPVSSTTQSAIRIVCVHWAVRRLNVEFETRGMCEKITSFSFAASVLGSGRRTKHVVLSRTA